MADVKELNINNTNYDIKAKSVVDQNSGAIKIWTGTRAQYNAITTKDSATLYNITDDTNVTLSLLELLYPVGAIYIGTMATCPLATLGVGTWVLKASDRVLQGAGTQGSVGDSISAGLPNITGWFNGYASSYTGGVFYQGDHGNNISTGSTGTHSIDFDASRSSSIYGNSSTVQPPAYLVNIWERTA